MTKSNPRVFTPEDVVSKARRFQHRAIATLMAVCEDERAPASAKSQAAAKLLEIGHGRPAVAKPIAAEDIASLDDDQCERLFHALLRRIEAKQPAFHAKMIRGIVDEMLAAQAAQVAPKKSNFKRGPLAGKGPEVPRWPPAPRAAPPLAPAAAAIRSDLSGEAAPVRHAATTHPADAAVAPLKTEDPDNVVVQLPGTARADRLPPYGLVYGLDTDLERSRATALNPHGGVHPSVVLRAAQKDPWRGR